MAPKPIIIGLLLSLALHLALLALPRRAHHAAVPASRPVEVGLVKTIRPSEAPAAEDQPEAIPALSEVAEPAPAAKPGPNPQPVRPQPKPQAPPAALTTAPNPPALKPPPQLKDQALEAPAANRVPPLPVEKPSSKAAPESPPPAPASNKAASGGTPPPSARLQNPPQSTAPAAERPVLTTPPGYLHTPRPPYPRQARQRRWEGEVLLRVRVGTGGRVLEASLERSSGYPVLDRAALEGVRAWRFRPATRDGLPVEEEVRVPVHFNLLGS